MLPDNSTITATHVGILTISQFLSKVRIAYKFPNIKKSLISNSAICNDDGSAVFNKDNIFIIYKGKIILKCNRDKSTGLWLILLSNIQNKIPDSVNLFNNNNIVAAVIESTSTKKEVVHFLHATCYYPVKST